MVQAVPLALNRTGFSTHATLSSSNDRVANMVAVARDYSHHGEDVGSRSPGTSSSEP